MDYQEAIEILKRNKPVSGPRRCGKELCTACDVAIFAMQELQALHNQGISLKCLGNIGFRNEVIEHINYVQYKDLKDKLEQYEQLGTLEEVREAMEKQKAKKPTYDGDGYAPDGTFVWDEWIYPKCGTRYEVDYDDYDYCPYCGAIV